MSQVPLAPPPQTGQPIDSWLYLLWQRVTAAGQILWSSITPSTSADVAAVVTDETGSPGSLVFSGNPTLTGLTVSGAAFTSRGITDNATATALTIDSSGRSLFGYGTSVQVAGISPTLQINAASAVANFSIVRNTTPGGSGAFLYLSATRGPAGTNTAVQAGDGLGSIFASGADGTNIVNGAAITFRAEGTISTGIVPATIVFYTYNSSGVLTEAAQFNSSQICTFSGPSTAPALKVTPVASQARWIEVTGATSSGNPTVGVSGGILAISASVDITGVVSTSGYTVATLPAGTVGDRAYVTDALAPAYGVAVAGGGAVTVPVFYNGAAWICA